MIHNNMQRDFQKSHAVKTKRGQLRRSIGAHIGLRGLQLKRYPLWRYKRVCYGSNSFMLNMQNTFLRSNFAIVVKL